MKPLAVDISARWACPRCPYKHAPLAACPPPGVWLVLELCPRCDQRTGLYCRTHRDRHLPQPGDAHHAMPEVPHDDAQRRAAGEKEDA